MEREYTLIIERGEDGYFIGSVLELPGCHTQGKTIEELLENIKEAIELCLEAEVPERLTQFVGIQKISI